MNDATEKQILNLLDVLSVQVAEGHAELRGDIRSVAVKVDGLDAKVDLSGMRFGRSETRVEALETDARSFRNEFERRVAPLERRNPK